MKWSASALTGPGHRHARRSSSSRTTSTCTRRPRTPGSGKSPGSVDRATLKYSNRPGIDRDPLTRTRPRGHLERHQHRADRAQLGRRDEATNYGVRIDENGNNYTYWKRLVSVEQSGSYVHVPRIVYTSHTLSATPVAGGHPGAVGRAHLDLRQLARRRAQTQFQVKLAASADCASRPSSRAAPSRSRSQRAARAAGPPDRHWPT